MTESPAGTAPVRGDRDWTALNQALARDAEVFARMLGAPNLVIRFEVPSGDEPSGDDPAIRWAEHDRQLVIDPRHQISEGYEPEEIVYAILMELLLHSRAASAGAELDRDLARFRARGDAAAVFHEVFSRVAASRLIRALLPRWGRIGQRLHQERLYPETQQLDSPRHLQFLSKVVRDQLVPGSQTQVAPEVDALLAEFHDYLGTGRDLLEYSTRHAKSPTAPMTASEQFAIWSRNIYPRWLELLRLDQADNPGLTGFASTQDAPASGSDRRPIDFGEQYDQHRKKRNPIPIDPSDRETLNRALGRPPKREPASPALLQDAQLRAETGHGRSQYQRYVHEVERFREHVSEIRKVYRELLERDLQRQRALRPGLTEGAVLSPERLAQTVLDIRTKTPDPPAFSDFIPRTSPRDNAGKADYVFVFDCSGSMMGEKSAAAASAAVICLEALSGMQRDAQAAAEHSDVDLQADVRSAIFTYSDTIRMPKALSSGLTLKERLDTLADVRSTNGGNADTHVLQRILDYPPAPERTRTLFVIADGEADDPDLARTKVQQLRGRGWRVFGISIGSEAAVILYAPHSHRVDDPALLPQVLQRLIRESL